MVNIHSNPSDTFIPLGESITFTCTDFTPPSLVYFVVTIEALERSEVTITSEDVRGLHEHMIFTEPLNDTLRVLATMDNNQTSVQCVTLDESRSDIITVIVIGKFYNVFYHWRRSSL